MNVKGKVKVKVKVREICLVNFLNCAKILEFKGIKGAKGMGGMAMLMLLLKEPRSKGARQGKRKGG